LPLKGIALSYPSADGSVATEFLSAGAAAAEIRVPKLSVVAVTAAPYVEWPAAALKPAGAVFPWHLDAEGALVLSWEQGFVGEALLGCGLARVQSVNVGKLTEAITAKSGGNPWRLDLWVLRGAIERGELTSRAVVQLPAFDLDLPVGPGTWISGDPFDPTLSAGDGGVLTIFGLTTGVHGYFRSHSGERMGVEVTTAGWTAVIPDRGVGLCGRW
jgi:hypothetical protein